MDKQEVIAFFDRCAPTWDAEQIDRSAAIEEILDNAGVSRGQRVLDVACGTGILFPFYLERGVGRIVGIDISPEMARLAREKFASEERISVICGDVEEAAFEEPFDRVVLHNAFPHFPDPDRLIARLASFLRPGGVLTIAHSMSREQINEHHKGSAARVSCGLMPSGELAARMGKHLTVTSVISDDAMYQVVGVKEGSAAPDYKELSVRLRALIEGVPYLTASLANASALLWETLPGINWAGFYLADRDGLVLGPFQGKPACILIAPGRGVCGAAAAEDRTQRVADVHAFPGHIACDSASRSEIVVPLHKAGKVIGVLDIDSPYLNRFTAEDQKGLEAFAHVLEDELAPLFSEG